MGFSHNNFIPGIVHFKQVRNENKTAVDNLMAMT